MTQLPPEILSQVFAATESIEAVLALSQTCKLLNSIWTLDKEPISKSVLPLSLPSFELAQNLVWLNRSTTDVDPEPAFNKSILSTAHEAALALTLFTENLAKPYGKTPFFFPRRVTPPYLLKTERLRFIHAYQTAKFLVVCPKESRYAELLTRALQQLSLHVYFHVRDTATWLSRITYHGYRHRWSEDSSEELYNLISLEAKEWWEDAAATIDELYHHHPAIEEKRALYACGYPEMNPEGIFTLFDQCQDEMVEINAA